MDFSTKTLKKILKCPLLQEMDADKAVKILSGDDCEAVEFAAKDPIMSSGLNERKIGILLSGNATAFSPHPEKMTFLRKLSCGDAFGVSSAFSRSNFMSSVVAQSTCTVFFIGEQSLLLLLEQDPAFLRRYLSFLSERIAYLNHKIGYLTAGSVERKLALYLLAFQSSEVTLDVSISTLSDLLDVGRASIYRAFDKLIEDGYILKRGRKITLLSSEALLQAYQ